MVPKQMILRFEQPKELTDKFRRKIEAIMPVFFDTPHSHIFKMILDQEPGLEFASNSEGQSRLSLNEGSSGSEDDMRKFEKPTSLK